MPEKRLSARDFSAIGEWIKSEKERRKGKRRDLEAIWKEIDRQVAMIPIPRVAESGTNEDWHPNTELPLQANALEVIAADARRIKFPRNTDWFSVSAEITSAYERRFEERKTLIEASPVNPSLDQETANILVKATMDHFHKLYDFRSSVDLLDIEAIKYGTFVARVRPTNMAKFTGEYRGIEDLVGPSVIACSVKNTYLDDSPSAVLHEGLNVSPSVLRVKRQSIDALKQAASKGGPEKGWISSQLRLIEPPKDRMLELIEIEGDLVVPKSRGSIFLPNVIVTIATDAKAPRPVRFLENPVPFRSYVTGHYMRQDVESPYGTSPLVMGQPLQEAATKVLNDLVAVGALNAEPPLTYDRFDPNFAANGGPDWFPGAKNPADSPNAVEVMQTGDVSALLNAYLGLIKQYEDLTGVTDPRRGAPIRSHTTARGNEIEASRGVVRTDDFVSGVEQGPMTSILHMEYAIIKDRLRSAIPVPVNEGGISGWVRIAAADLADRVSFKVQGSSGTLDRQQADREFESATAFAMQLVQAAAQLQVGIPLKFQELIVERFNRAGINDASRFVGTAEDISQGTPDGFAVPGAGAGPQTLNFAALAAAGGAGRR